MGMRQVAVRSGIGQTVKAEGIAKPFVHQPLYIGVKVAAACSVSSFSRKSFG